MRRMLRTLLVSTAATTVAVTAAISGVDSALAGATWGSFQGENMKLPAGSEIVSLRRANGGLAARVSGGTASTDLYADRTADKDATVIAVRTRRADDCPGDKQPRLNVTVDSQSLRNYSVSLSSFTYKMVPLPDSILHNAQAPFLGRTHRIDLTVIQPGDGCTRLVDIDMGGYWSIGMIASNDFTVVDGAGSALAQGPATWNYDTDVRNGTTVDTLVLNGNGIASGAMGDASQWNDQVRLEVAGTQCDGIWPTIDVSIDGKSIGEVVVDHSRIGDEVLPLLGDNRIGNHTLSIKVTNAVSSTTCRRSVAIDWVHGASLL